MDINLTIQERAAACLYVFDGIKDRTVLFTLANGEERAKRLTPKSLKVAVNNWFNSHKIQTAIKYYKTVQEEKTERLRLEILAGAESKPAERDDKTGPRDHEKTNFLDRDEFLQFLNSRANDIQDDKLRNDILKMLSDNLRYKDTESAENTEIQRFYTPILCQNCSIYKAAKGEK